MPTDQLPMEAACLNPECNNLCTWPTDGRGRPPRFCSTQCRTRVTYAKKQLLLTWAELARERRDPHRNRKVDEIDNLQAHCRWLLERYQVLDPAEAAARLQTRDLTAQLSTPDYATQDWVAAAEALLRLRPTT